MADYFFDSNRVRFKKVKTHAEGPYNLLFLPGGPGADSRYLQSLIDILELSGNAYLIDLPGNGDNTNEIPTDYNYDEWFDIFLPTIQEFENPILVGHSFGGMFPLLFNELENILKGFVILHSAPSLWLEEAIALAKTFNLPDLSMQMQAFTLTPNKETFSAALDACLPYYFPPQTLEKGRELLSNLPYQFQAAVWWQCKAFEMNFTAKWIPQQVPTLIVGSPYDCICPFTLFQKDIRFSRPNITFAHIQNAGHCSWVDNPHEVRAKFNEFLRFKKNN